MKLPLKSSPHSHNQRHTAQMMREVIFFMLPGVAMQCYWFGAGTLVQICLAIVTALGTEALLLTWRQQPIRPALSDNSALLTALLLAVALPPIAPYWLVILGSFFAIAIAKQLYGGIGYNIFNPAMVGYVVLLISFPSVMIQWPVPLDLQINPLSFADTLQLIFGQRTDALLSQATQMLDGQTGATVLDYFKTQQSTGKIRDEIIQSHLFQDGVGVGWFWINAAYLLAGLLMLYRGIIRWYIPVSILFSFSVCLFIGFMLSPSSQGSLWFHLFSGATMIGAFFIATDPVSAAVSSRGKLFYGALIGICIYIIRTQGNYPDAVAFSVLIANMVVPFLDLYTQPKVYGEKN